MLRAHLEKGPLRRLFGRRSNELWRAADRMRSRWIIAFALAPILAVLCAVAIGMAVWNTEITGAHAESLHRHRVSATTVGETVRAPPEPSNGVRTATAQTVWEYPSSHRHRDRVPVPADTPVGGTVVVWVDDAGRETAAPPSGSELASTAVAAGVAAFAVFALSAGGVVRLGLRRVDARSLAEWGREWELVEPHWSGRERRGPGAEED
ncbi:hypothetical protein OHA98_14935 [Streptomyces sp. NBC_00654]|uniref:Rv1733c family protein n=1 Tax=Streptomyces sp. NBC_00654 TaxID=2975799 RepID=UPI002250D807|nr:hypothetical protein [Streptomyces sp. NBC_00654]MCX4966112.1 hypothetical protein [Streptomyces sp. NBC_00654]